MQQKLVSRALQIWDPNSLDFAGQHVSKFSEKTS